MDSRPDDETLLLAVAERDMGAFRTLAVQDTFVAVWQKPRGFRGDGDIAAWLWGIAIRRLVSRLRTRGGVAAVYGHAGVAPAAEDQVLLSVEYGDISQALAGQRAARIRRGVRGQDADRRTGRDGRRRRRAGADGAQPRAAGRAVRPHIPGTRRQRAVLGITCSGSSSRCACWPSLSRSAAEVCPGGCPVFRDPGDYGLEGQPRSADRGRGDPGHLGRASRARVLPERAGLSHGGRAIRHRRHDHRPGPGAPAGPTARMRIPGPRRPPTATVPRRGKPALLPVRPPGEATP